MTGSVVEVLAEARRLGFLGPGPVEPHLQHALAFAEAVSIPPARALDLGAGGGLPGLVLATLVWPEAWWTLLDSQQRRTAFLADAVEDLDLAARVTVVHGRAEETGRDPRHRGGYELVVARSFAAPAVTAECAAPLLRIGGALVVSEPPDSTVATRWPADGIAQVGFAPAEARCVEGDDPVHLAVLLLAEATAARYPRRVGMPAKRPLF